MPIEREGSAMAGDRRMWTRGLGPWLVAAAGFLALALAYSARATLALMMTTWVRELGWSRGFISGTAALALVVIACVAPIGGRLVDRQGPRNVLATGLAAVTAGCFVIAATSSALVFLIAFAVIAAVGFGLIATHVVATAVEQRFERHQGLAMGIATAGSTGGQFVILPLIAFWLTASSWRWSFVLLGFACLAMTAGVWWLIPGGAGTASGALRPSRTRATLRQDVSFIVKRPAFHVLLWSYVLCGYATTGVVETHFLPYAAFCGFAPLPSAAAYGVLSAVNLAGMILSGWLADRMSRPLLLGGIYILRGVAFMLLVGIVRDIDTLFFFAAVFGLVDYSTQPATASLAASNIGARVMGLSLGFILAGHSVGAALGAYLGGTLFDLSARYDWVWLSSAGLSVLAGGLVLMLSDGRARPARMPA
jgi:MFS family permease